MSGSERSLPVSRPGAWLAGSIGMPMDTVLVAAVGVVLIVAALVGTTVIGSGDYGQWLMVSREFAGLSTPAYRDLSDVPPLVPATIALLSGVLGDPVLALRVVAFAIAAGSGAALYAAGRALDGRAVTGLAAAILGLLVTDQFLELLAFGGLLQAVAIVFLTVAFVAFSQSLRSPRTERGWWLAGCAAMLLACLSHVPTATIAVPFCAVAAGIALLPPARQAVAARLRTGVPLLVAFGLVAAYWAVAVAPQSAPYVANPASLAYRGPDRLVDQLVGYVPTAAVIAIGGAACLAWAARLVIRPGLKRLRAPKTILVAWAATSWAAFGVSAIAGASTDYPRFAPLLVVPLAVAAAGGLAEAGQWLARRTRRRPTTDHALAAIALGVVAIAPFSIANYQTEAEGYRMPDAEALAAAATWADQRVVPGQTILAPVREAKWIEGLTGRSTLFAGQIRYAFRPAEWDRALAANALSRGDLTLVNESFVLTMHDAVRTDAGAQPRGLLVSANHGGEYLDLLRLVPASSVVLAGDGSVLASLPALDADGMSRSHDATNASVTTAWSGDRDGTTIEYAARLELAAQARSFDLTFDAASERGVGGLGAELRPLPGMPIVSLEPLDGGAILTFPRTGTTEPRLRLDVPDGTVQLTPDGSVAVASADASLTVTFTDLTAGGASASLDLLEPRELIDAYAVGAAVLRRDPSYEDRRDRLAFLGFRVAFAEGPYVVMVRAGFGRPAP